MLLNNKWVKIRSRKKSKDTLKQMKIKTLPKNYGTWLKQSYEGNSWPYRPMSRKKKNLK